MERIRDYFTDKVVLLTGATGLLGKVLTEKILRDLSCIRRLYVIIRPKHLADGTLVSAQERLHLEVLATSVFDRLRRMQGEAFSSLVEEKVVAVAGDLSQEHLGLGDATYKRLQDEVQVIINCAAMVTFDGALDAAVELNTLGPKRVLEFARGGRRPAIVHISTCYVNGTREGRIQEEPLDPQRAMHGVARGGDGKYDVDAEVTAIQRRVERVKAQSHRPWRRWPFALMERIRGDGRHGKGDEENNSGVDRLRQKWVERRLVAEGMRWARSRGWNDTYTFSKAMGEQMVMRYAGDLPVAIVRPAIIESSLEMPEPGWLDGFRMLDPIIVAYGRGALPNFPGDPQSVLDIVPVDLVANALLAIGPRIEAGEARPVYQIASGTENPISVGEFAELVQDYFRRETLTGRAGPPRTLPVVTFPSRRRFLRRIRYRYLLPLRVLVALSAVASVLPWARRFAANLRSRRGALERLKHYIEIYGPYSEVGCQYQTNHMREVWDGLAPEDREQFDFDVTRIDWKHYVQEVYIPGIKRFLLGVLPTSAATATKPTDGEQSNATGGEASPETPQRPSVGINLPSEQELNRWSRVTLPVSLGRSFVRGLMGLGFRYYTGFKCQGLEHLPKSGPFIIAANHNSHADTAAVLVAVGKRAETLNALAAKDYWFRNRLWGWAFHTFLGTVPFDRQGHGADSLGLAVGLLQRNHSLLFFPEGGRSNTGQMQPFKSGIGLLALESGMPVVPTHIQGTFRVLPKGRSLLKRHPVQVRFGPPILPDSYLHAGSNEGPYDLSRRITTDIQRAVEALA